jgi:hypothetical protein
MEDEQLLASPCSRRLDPSPMDWKLGSGIAHCRAVALFLLTVAGKQGRALTNL